MKFSLPIIGNVDINLGETQVDIETPSMVSVEDEEAKEKYLDVLGGFLTFAKSALSTEKTISSKLLKANKEWVYRNNDVIAQEVSKLELELYSINLRDGEIVFDIVEESPLLDLLDKFNPRTTKSDGIYTTQSHKKLTGDAFWLLDKNGQAIENIFILPPDKIELELASPTDPKADLVSQYIYRDNIDGKNVIQRYQPDEIIHFKKPNPDNMFRGYGAVEAIAETIDADNLSNLTQKNFFDKGAITNFVLTTDSKITQDQLKRMRAELRAMYTGARNAFTTMIFGNGLKPSPVGMSNRDMQFLDILEWYRDKIMLGFGNTKASLGLIDDVNRASFEKAYYSWLESTIKPDMSAIVNTLNEFLVPLYGENLILGYKNPVPEDITDDIEQSVKLKAAGIMTINEARQKVGLDAVPDGDIFAPTGGVAVPGEQNEENTPNPDEEQKRIYRRGQTELSIKNVPNSLKGIDLKSVLRRRGIYLKKRMNQEFKEAVKPMIRKMLDKKKNKTVMAGAKDEAPIHSQFTNEEINKYYEKQIYVVDVLEGQFHEAVLKLLTIVEEQTLSNFQNEFKTVRGLKGFMRKKQLFDQEALKLQAETDLLPILIQEVTMAGQEAMRLIGSEDVYVPFKIKETIRTSVDKFATSMLETDKEYLTQLINDSIEAGDSIPEISSKIESRFGQYKEMQATRIARTEVLRAANMAAEDAFIQSGVVEAKQWLIAPGADEQCIPYNGRIVKLRGNFYDPDESGFQDGNPPIHINCRCILVPIVTGTRGIAVDFSKEKIFLQQKVKELESKIDKRTKAYKSIKADSADDKVYIKALEKHLGLEDE